MRLATSAFYVPIVLCAIGFTLVFQGCEKAQEAPPRESPASYMNDKEFIKKVAGKRDEMLALMKERQPLMERMDALVKEHGDKVETLAKIPEWVELQKKVTEINEKCKALRDRQLSIVRARITPKKKEISK